MNSQQQNFHGHPLIGQLITYLAGVNLLILAGQLWMQPLTVQQNFFLLAFAFITLMLLVFRRQSFTFIYLTSTFSALVIWRLCALADLTLLSYLYGILLLAKLISYMLCAYYNLSERHYHGVYHETPFEWQLFFIRLFIGLDMVPHFCEKLFAGSAIRALDVKAFVALGVPHPLAFVFLAGAIELFGALAISCGFLTRLASVALVIYLLVATMLGHHFSLGFIWASPGGGWEYPVFWSVLILSFACFGAGEFSIDGLLKRNFRIPRWFCLLQGGRFKHVSIPK